MDDGYFHRVSKLTPTKFWINNPTRKEADLAITSGASGCTLNPSYTQKMIDHPEEGEYARQVLDDVIREVRDDTEAVSVFQRRMAARICEKFMPIFEASNQQEGYVSIQGDPIRESDPYVIISEAYANRTVSPNVCCKIPTTASGLKAIVTLIPANVPMNATEIFAVRQGLDLGELYERLVPKTDKGPMLYYSHIAGIYDDYLKLFVERNHVDIPADYLLQAGLAVSRKLYGLVKKAGYRMSFVGGGARGLHHFTELVGGEVNLTINWVGTADALLAQNQPVISRIFNPVSPAVLETLLTKLPDFRRGYEDDGIQQQDYEEFGPVELFRGSFIKSWKRVLDLIHIRRAEISLQNIGA